MFFLRILVVILANCCMFSTKIWHYCTFKDSINKASVNVGDCFNLNQQYGLSVSEKNTDTKWWQNHSSFLNNTVRSQMVTWKSEISQLKFLFALFWSDMQKILAWIYLHTSRYCRCFNEEMARGMLNKYRHETEAERSSITEHYFMILHISQRVPADSQLEQTTDFTFDFSVLQSIIRKARRLH